MGFIGIPNIQKEILPYKYYTLDRLSKGAIGVIEECGNTVLSTVLKMLISLD